MKKTSLTFIFAIFTFLALPIVVNGQDAELVKERESKDFQKLGCIKVSMQTAVEKALEQNCTLQLADWNIQKESYAYKENIGQLFPKIDASANYGYTIKKQVMYFDGIPGVARMFGDKAERGIEMGRTHNIQAGVSFSMPIVHPQLWKSIQMSKERLALAVEKANTSKVNKIAEVQKAYLQVLLARQTYLVFDQNYQNALNSYQSISNKFKQGLVSEYDLLRSEVQVNNLKPNLLQLQENYRLAQKQLLILMGFDPELSLFLEENLDSFKEELLMEKVQEEEKPLKNNSALREMNKQEALVESAVDISRLAFIPTLSLSGRYIYNFGSNSFNLNNSRLWSPFSIINISLSFPLFSGGRKFFSLKKQKIELLQFQLQRKETENQLKIALEQNQNRIKRSIEAYKIAEKTIKTAEKGYKIAQRRLAIGEGTLLETQEANIALLQAQLNCYQILYEYLVAKIDLRKIKGEQAFY